MTSTENSNLKVTPMMAQWYACKEVAKDSLLFFRMGDFYEAFHDDAVIISKEADLTLTKRQDTPMCGVPHHTIESYIDKLVAKGYRVAVAEQTSDPKAGKGLVSREVVRVVTPGTLINSSLLAEKSNNYFACISRVGSFFGLAVIDLSTADFTVSEFESQQDLLNEIFRLRPAEFIASDKLTEKHASLFTEIRHTYDFLLSSVEDWRFEHQLTYGFLVTEFNVHSLDGFGLKGMVASINAAGALLAHLKDTLCLPVNHVREIRPYTTSNFLTLDRMTVSNLELTHSLRDGSRRNTLLAILDKTKTAMGGRLMQHLVKQPLLDPNAIMNRQDAIECFLKNQTILDQVQPLLIAVKDLERLIMKISTNYATPRDIASLRFSMEPLAPLKKLLSALTSSTLITQEVQNIDTLPEMIELIANAFEDEPPVRLSDGKVFREGYSKELDELREISRDSKIWLAKYQTKLRDDFDIKTLKVGFNKMFGYYIEISKGQTDKAPETFQRRQTLVNAERYITPELKEYEQKVLTAEDQIAIIESELFHQIRNEVAKYASQVLVTARAIAKIDCMQGLSEVARLYDYTRPLVDDSKKLIIEGGRHPVIEAANSSEKFVPNDTLLDDIDNRLLLITGPNMAGKSTYIRQVALISIMAQIGSFIPAKSAHLGIVDKVFTRIGASDDLSRGQSTFMVEMTETANILNNATSRSLVILDEIGRGTSTYDGISIAWSVAEHLLTSEERLAKTLFATHYFELTKLEEKIPGAVNYNVAVHESEDQIVFLRKIIRGDTDKSYGIHVARLAGIPMSVIDRAKEILLHLEENANRKSVFEPSKPKRKLPKKIESNEVQLSFFN